MTTELLGVHRNFSITMNYPQDAHFSTPMEQRSTTSSAKWFVSSIVAVAIRKFCPQIFSTSSCGRLQVTTLPTKKTCLCGRSKAKVSEWNLWTAQAIALCLTTKLEVSETSQLDTQTLACCIEMKSPAPFLVWPVLDGSSKMMPICSALPKDSRTKLWVY